MAAKTPKSWKSTKECIERVQEMSQPRRRLMMEIFINFERDEKWFWRIIIKAPTQQQYITLTERGLFDHEDQAANAAYKFAHKHLRPKRRKKRK